MSNFEWVLIYMSIFVTIALILIFVFEDKIKKLNH